MWIGPILLVVFIALFEVRLDVRFSLPAEVERPDPVQEARYAACYAEKDRQIHELAFGTIDNPDVQKLYISNNRDKARADCRDQFPERLITVEEPFRFTLFDLRFRY